MKCPNCAGKSSVLETRAPKRYRQCTACGTRFETVESVLPSTGRVASNVPSEVRRRRDAALAMPYVDANVLARELKCSPDTIRSIRRQAAAR